MCESLAGQYTSNSDLTRASRSHSGVAAPGALVGKMRTEIANHRAAVAARIAADDQWSKAGEPDSGAVWDASQKAFDHEHAAFKKFLETFPTTAAEAAALFERLAEPLYDGGDFSVTPAATIP